MVPVRDLFETHLTVVDLQRSMAFFGQVLGLELAEVFPERKVAFYWIGGRGNSMLGLWEVGTGPQRLSLHLAFRSDLRDLLDAPMRLRAADIVPLDFWGRPRRNPWSSPGCPPHRSISVTRMATCSNCSPCFPIPHNQN